jgi:hypothetical protein
MGLILNKNQYIRKKNQPDANAIAIAICNPKFNQPIRTKDMHPNNQTYPYKVGTYIQH